MPGSHIWVSRHATSRKVASSVRVRPLIVGSPSDIELFPARSSFADAGLKKHVLIFRRGKPVYVFDHHCFALYGWLEMRQAGQLSAPATLVRLDRHSDGLPGSPLPQKIDLPEILRRLYTSPLENASYLDPAVKAGLFNRIIWLKPNEDDRSAPRSMATLNALAKRNPACRIETFRVERLEDFIKSLGSAAYLLDIDFDFFVSATEGLLAWLAPVFQQAAAVTLETSPEYIEKGRTIGIARRIIGLI